MYVDVCIDRQRATTGKCVHWLALQLLGKHVQYGHYGLVDHNTWDINGMLVPDITDRELNIILIHIAMMKGNRITFILDCCHMGSVT